MTAGEGSPPLPPGTRAIVDPDDPRATIPGHAVRADGVVLYYRAAWRRWIPLKPKTGPGGHRKARIRISGPAGPAGDQIRELGIARLVCRAWHGPAPLGEEPLHYPDPSPANCRADNLRWAPVGTSKLGRRLGPTLPPAPSGDTHPHARLQSADIPEIRRMYRAGVPCAVIARGYGLSASTVENVLNGKTWRHVVDPEGPIGPLRRGPSSDAAAKTRIDREIAAAIRAAYAAGEGSHRTLGRRFGVSTATIRDIVTGRTWRTPAGE
jgi:hypothetical protein